MIFFLITGGERTTDRLFFYKCNLVTLFFEAGLLWSEWINSDIFHFFFWFFCYFFSSSSRLWIKKDIGILILRERDKIINIKLILKFWKQFFSRCYTEKLLPWNCQNVDHTSTWHYLKILMRRFFMVSGVGFFEINFFLSLGNFCQWDTQS